LATARVASVPVKARNRFSGTLLVLACARAAAASLETKHKIAKHMLAAIKARAKDLMTVPTIRDPKCLPLQKRSLAGGEFNPYFANPATEKMFSTVQAENSHY
jgi:hypothetical protein